VVRQRLRSGKIVREWQVVGIPWEPGPVAERPRGGGGWTTSAVNEPTTARKVRFKRFLRFWRKIVIGFFPSILLGGGRHDLGRPISAGLGRRGQFCSTFPDPGPSAIRNGVLACGAGPWGPHPHFQGGTGRPVGDAVKTPQNPNGGGQGKNMGVCPQGRIQAWATDAGRITRGFQTKAAGGVTRDQRSGEGTGEFRECHHPTTPAQRAFALAEDRFPSEEAGAGAGQKTETGTNHAPHAGFFRKPGGRQVGKFRR